MAKSFHSDFIFVFLLSAVIIYRSNSSSIIDLNIEIAEELPVGTEVADLAAEAGLDIGLDELQFDVISCYFYNVKCQYFTIGGDKSRDGHLLVVDRTLDRDVICSHRSALTRALYTLTNCISLHFLTSFVYT